MLSSAKNFFLDLIFPPRCTGCGAEGSLLCTSCTQKIQLKKIQHCPVCWQASFGGKTCKKCRPSSPIDGLRVAASYSTNPELKKAVAQLKYKFSEQLTTDLATILAKKIDYKNLTKKPIICPVPLHPQRKKWRGFNQAELLAKSVAAKLDYPLVEILERTKNTEQQAKLSRVKRLENLQNAFTVKPGKNSAGETIILVDDIASTGATLIECAKELKKAGVKSVWGLVIARG